MRKVIKVQDIRNMVKIFNLSDDEKWELEDMANDINSEKGEIARDVQATLLYGTRIKARNDAMNTMLIYFAEKIQQKIGWKLDQTTWELEKLLKVGSYQVRQWFFSMHFEPRFKDYVSLSDTFGLNYLEISYIVVNYAENRLQIVYEEKPSVAVRDSLKKCAFHWAPSEGAWQRQLTTSAISAAVHVLFGSDDSEAKKELSNKLYQAL